MQLRHVDKATNAAQYETFFLELQTWGKHETKINSANAATKENINTWNFFQREKIP